MKSFYRSISFSAGFFLLLSLGFAQTKTTPDNKEEILRLDTNLVLIDIGVSSRSGGEIKSTLRPDDFSVYEDGVKQKIETFSTTELPLNIVLLVDTSASTKGELDLIKKAAKRFLDELRPQDNIAVIEFNQKVTTYENLTKDREKIGQALDWIQPGTGTSFYQAMQTAVEVVLAKVEGRKAIIALTDGVDSDGAPVYEDVLQMLEKSRVAAYFLELNTEDITEAGIMRDCEDQASFHFSLKQLTKYVNEWAEGVDTSQYQDHCTVPRLERMQINRRLYESARRELREMSQQTGGRVYPCKRLTEIGPAYSQVAAELRTQYTLGYYPSNEKHDGKWRTLKVEVRKSDIVGKAKPGYRAPGQ